MKNTSVFLIGGEIEVENFISALKDRSHKVIYWVGSRGAKKIEFPGVIFHDYLEAYNGKPAAGFELSDFFPPGEDLINQLHKTESLFLTMMHKHFDWMPAVDERRRFYYNALQYWHGMLKKCKPGIIIFFTIPHAPFSYLIYELAHLLNIKTIVLDHSIISDRSIVHTDFRKSSAALQRALQKNKGKKFSLQGLESDLQEYYASQTKSDHNQGPVYLTEQIKEYTLTKKISVKIKAIMAGIRNLTVFEQALGYFLKLFKQNLKKEYLSVQSQCDFTKKFIYAPLNYQPECSTSPQADIFVDQILAIEILSSSVPNGWLVYVKEHPVQWLPRGLNYFSSRYQGYYKKIAQLKNVKLIPIETNSYTLINKAQLVATITGSTGWEAALRFKPVIIFGYPWYRDCPGVFKVNSTESCKEALKKIIAGFKISQQQIINYFKSFDEATIHGYVDDFGRKNSKLTEEENVRNITQAILAEIEKISACRKK